jgi:hypothetical protein
MIGKQGAIRRRRIVGLKHCFGPAIHRTRCLHCRRETPPPLALNDEYPAGKLVVKPGRLVMVSILFTARKNCQRRDLFGNTAATLNISQTHLYYCNDYEALRQRRRLISER